MFLSQKLPLYFFTFIITIWPQRSIGTRTTKQNTIIPIGRSNSEGQDLMETTRLPMKGESGINYGNLEISEPGFDFTDEEIQKLRIWPGGIIPYFIDDFSFDKVVRDKLRAFLDHTNTVTGVRFSEMAQPPDDDSRWVFFINRRGVLPCADLDYRQFNNTGVQKVVIGYDCMEPGNLAEIALAVVGVPPQHNSPDRDKHVEVQKDNILSGKEHLFEKFSDSEWLFHEVDYDFTSAGHYGYHKYTSNGGATLKPLEAVDVRAGEATSFSYSDIWKIRMLYNYISKKGRMSKDDKGSCSKLFKPGAKFRDFIPDDDEEDEVKPRPKPSKYTGIPEEKLSEPDDDDDDDQNKENSYKGGEGNMQADESSEDNNDFEEHRNEPGTKNKLKRPKKKKTQTDVNKTRLWYESDIQTDE